MPYRDRERQRAAERDCQRRRRAGLPRQTRRQTLPALEELRFGTARDVLRLLNGQAEAVLRARRLGVVERARAVGYLAALLLRAVEVGELERRLETLEARAAAWAAEHEDGGEVPC